MHLRVEKVKLYWFYNKKIKSKPEINNLTSPVPQNGRFIKNCNRHFNHHSSKPHNPCKREKIVYILHHPSYSTPYQLLFNPPSTNNIHIFAFRSKIFHNFIFTKIFHYTLQKNNEYCGFHKSARQPTNQQCHCEENTEIINKLMKRRAEDAIFLINEIEWAEACRWGERSEIEWPQESRAN